MTHRTSLVYRKTAILNEFDITVTEERRNDNLYETVISFFNPVKIGDKVMPCGVLVPTKKDLPIVLKDNGLSPEGIYTFGIVVSEPRLVKMPEKSMSHWDEIFKNEYYRVAVVDFYNFEWDL